MKRLAAGILASLALCALVAWPAMTEACVGKTLYLGRMPGMEQEILAELFVWLVSERTGTSIEIKTLPHIFPYGIYSIPEISMVGQTEEQLTEAGIRYEFGLARYREIARGAILGDDSGMLKLLFHLETREILGVHIIGTSATELVHIGQTAMAFKGTLDFFVNNVFNYPTLAEAYKIAALNGINKLQHV